MNEEEMYDELIEEGYSHNQAKKMVIETLIFNENLNSLEHTKERSNEV